MLPDAGMIVVAIAERAVLIGEVEAINLLVASLVGLSSHLIEYLLGNLQFLVEQHRTTEEHDLRLGIMLAHHLQQHLITLLEQFHVVVVGREVVGAEIDADHIGLVTAEIPFLAWSGTFAPIGIGRTFVGTICDTLRQI